MTSLKGRETVNTGRGTRDAGREGDKTLYDLPQSSWSESDWVLESPDTYEPLSKTVRNFEDLLAWQKARELTRLVYQVTSVNRLASDLGLKGQMQRAAVSVMANIAEGHERGTIPEYHHFLTMAKASCAELRSHLYVALDVSYLEQARFDELQRLVIRVSQLVGALRRSIGNQKEEMRMTGSRPASRVPRLETREPHSENSEGDGQSRPASRVPRPETKAKSQIEDLGGTR